MRAHNAHGWGPESDPLEIVAAAGPDTPAPPTTSIHNHYIRIQWTTPYQNSAPINAYKVFIGETTSINFIEDTTYCDGSIEPVLSNKYCDVPMSALRASPYWLTFDQEVKAKVSASNVYGSSDLSGVSTVNAKIQTEP